MHALGPVLARERLRHGAQGVLHCCKGGEEGGALCGGGGAGEEQGRGVWGGGGGGEEEGEDGLGEEEGTFSVRERGFLAGGSGGRAHTQREREGGGVV